MDAFKWGPMNHFSFSMCNAFCFVNILCAIKRLLSDRCMRCHTNISSTKGWSAMNEGFCFLIYWENCSAKWFYFYSLRCNWFSIFVLFNIELHFWNWEDFHLLHIYVFITLLCDNEFRQMNFDFCVDAENIYTISSVRVEWLFENPISMIFHYSKTVSIHCAKSRSLFIWLRHIAELILIH